MLETKYSELDVSERTIRRNLNRLGYTSVLPRKVPLLTQQAKVNRLTWARDHLHYNWNKVVFSDEASSTEGTTTNFLRGLPLMMLVQA